jgi:hypothetical protein
MRKPQFHPDQTTLPIELLPGRPVRPVKYLPRKLSRRRAYPGAPTIGIDYGFEHGEAGETDPQGYEDVTANVVPVVYFDFEQVFRHLDGDRDEDAREAIVKLAAEAFAGMLEWLQEEFVSPGTDIRWRLDTATRCKLALLTLYQNPGLIGNPTLEELANNLGISKQKLSILWAEFKRRFPGVVAPWEKSEAAKEASRAAQQGDN